MKFLYPIVFGISSSFIASNLGYGLDDIGYWLISGPFILVGGLLFARSY